MRTNNLVNLNNNTLCRPNSSKRLLSSSIKGKIVVDTLHTACHNIQMARATNSRLARLLSNNIKKTSKLSIPSSFLRVHLNRTNMI